MDNYVKRVINELTMKISKSDTYLTPAGNNIFEKGKSKILGKKLTDEFHTSSARNVFVAKIEIPDIHQEAAVLSTRVKEPNDTDWKKLARMIKYLNGKNKITLP